MNTSRKQEDGISTLCNYPLQDALCLLRRTDNRTESSLLQGTVSMQSLSLTSASSLAGMFLCAWCCRCLVQELCFGEWPKKTDRQAELECTEESHEILCASRAFRILVAEKILLQFCKQSVVLLCCGRSTDAASVVILSLGVRKNQKMAVFGSRTRAIGTAR